MLSISIDKYKITLLLWNLATTKGGRVVTSDLKCTGCAKYIFFLATSLSLSLLSLSLSFSPSSLVFNLCFIFCSSKGPLCHTYPRAPEAPTHWVAGFDLGFDIHFPYPVSPNVLFSLSFSLSPSNTNSLSFSELNKSVCVREMSKEWKLAEKIDS